MSFLCFIYCTYNSGSTISQRAYALYHGRHALGITGTYSWFSLTGYSSGLARPVQVCDIVRRTGFFSLLFGTFAHDSIDTPAHSLVDLAPKQTQASSF
jgi:hypothetical protein